MLVFLNVLIACTIITIIMIVMVELGIKLRNQDVKEWEVRYASENQKRHQGSNEDKELC